MGQHANSGRHSSLDDKKLRAAGRKQNDPSMQAITERESTPPVGGAFGSGSREPGRGKPAAEGNESTEPGKASE